MVINPTAIALAVPVASRIAQTAIHQVGQGLSFINQFRHDDPSVIDVSRSTPTIGQQLDSISRSMQAWLSDNGIRAPYEIQIGSSKADKPSNLLVQGEEAERIRDLLTQNPDRLAALERLADSIQAVSNSLGDSVAKLSITDLSSSITY